MLEIGNEKVGELKTIFYGGEEYTKHYQTQDEIRWRCKQQAKGCRSRIFTDLSTFNVLKEKCYFTHCHDSVEKEMWQLSSPRTVSLEMCEENDSGRKKDISESHSQQAKSTNIDDGNVNMDSHRNNQSSSTSRNDENRREMSPTIFKIKKKHRLLRVRYHGYEYFKRYELRSGLIRFACIDKYCNASIYTDPTATKVLKGECSRTPHSHGKNATKKPGEEISYPISADDVPLSMRSAHVLLDKINFPLRRGRGCRGVGDRRRGPGRPAKSGSRRAVRKKSEVSGELGVPGKAVGTDISRKVTRRALPDVESSRGKGGSDQTTSEISVIRRPRGRPPASGKLRKVAARVDDSLSTTDFRLSKRLVKRIQTEESSFSIGELHDSDSATQDSRGSVSDEEQVRTVANKPRAVTRKRRRKRKRLCLVKSRVSKGKRRLLENYRNQRGEEMEDVSEKTPAPPTRKLRVRRCKGIAYGKWAMKNRTQPSRRSKRFSVKSEIIDFTPEQLKTMESYRYDVIKIDSDSESSGLDMHQDDVSNTSAIHDSVSQSCSAKSYESVIPIPEGTVFNSVERPSSPHRPDKSVTPSPPTFSDTVPELLGDFKNQSVFDSDQPVVHHTQEYLDTPSPLRDLMITAEETSELTKSEVICSPLNPAELTNPMEPSIMDAIYISD